MTVLHVLISYLAALAVAALPFHPFAFASPLAAIDYDGYVDTAHNHRVNNSTLMKRVPGDIILETRQAVLLLVVPVVVIGIVVDVALIVSQFSDDNTRREQFTQNTINRAISQYPKFNWIICHSPYSVDFDGVEGTDWDHTHHELAISFDRTIGYDLYWTRSGTFYRYGDGGFINWAYNGNILGTDDGGGTVHFGTIS